MSFDATPITHIPGLALVNENDTVTAEGKSLLIPFATIPGADQDDFDPHTGDIRKIAYCLIELLHATWSALDYDDRPKSWQSNRSTSFRDGEDSAERSYYCAFAMKPPAMELKDEPVEP